MNNFSHLIDLDAYSVPEWNMIVELAEDIKKTPRRMPRGARAR